MSARPSQHRLISYLLKEFVHNSILANKAWYEAIDTHVLIPYLDVIVHDALGVEVADCLQ